MFISPNRATALLAALLTIALYALPANAYEPPRSALVIDVDRNKILHQQSSKAPRHPASLTKMMTLYLVFEALEAGKIKMDTPVTGSRYSADRPPSRLGLVKDESITIDLAIDALVVRSANDVAAAIAELFSGTEEVFAEKMTAKARQLGMTNTVYRNASGLPDKEQITTARDQAILGMALKRNFPGYFPRFSVPSVAYKDRSWNSHNKLLQKVATVTGIKTGFINASGFNVVTYSEESAGDKIVVVMGGRTARERDKEVIALLERFGSNTPVASNSDQSDAGNMVASTDKVPPGVDTMTTGSIPPNEISPYAIQIGALPSQEGAMERLTAVRPALPDAGNKLRQFTLPLTTDGSTVYRARIVGFKNLRVARDACKIMQSRDIECMALKHR